MLLSSTRTHNQMKRRYDPFLSNERVEEGGRQDKIGLGRKTGKKRPLLISLDFDEVS